ncbi:restriction endonuclease [Micromonospora sonneratiae]|uniref:Restriction endonuclease n=1 Tax=Micromonospora sonneratiae TaxID=1184706 RepID=A0ABW3YBX8_9ACTN
MHRVRSYRRRDGTRVRGHTRKDPRRGYARGGRDNGWLLLGGGLGALVALALIVEFVRRHPYWSALIVFVIVGLGVTVLWLLRRIRLRQAAERAELDRVIEATDTMTGSEFERWFARLLARSGCTAVEVKGGSGDRGADIVARAPDGRRVVVQCKRHKPGNRVGSAVIQRFAGTCFTTHRGEICMIVTNGSFTAGDGQILARELGIQLVDRTVLEVWAHAGVAPPPIARLWHPAPPT